MASLKALTRLVRDELIQRRQEGGSVGTVARRLEALLANPRDDLSEQLEKLLTRLSKLKIRKGYHYIEPGDLDGIRAQRQQGFAYSAVRLSQEQLADRILGAWQGRAAGCLLGKPCEGWSRDKIESYLKRADAWSLDSYFPYVESLAEEFDVHPDYRTDGTRGNIKGMMRDDDMDYTVLALHVLENCGADFTSEDVGRCWLELLPYDKTYTAERAAYRNLVNGLIPPATAVHHNPYREWIGAQIRADLWGYVWPGRPERAAEFAYRDACVSHTANGIYGEMLFAATISAALVGSDVRAAVDTGLAQIPERSRLNDAVQFVMKLHTRGLTWQQAHDAILKKYSDYHRVHTINNAALVILALLWGQGDFERTITIAVMSGLDTDCNGATAGSVMGALLGARGLPHARWIAPLRDRLTTALSGYHECRLSDLARRTEAAALQLHRADL